MKEDQPQSSLSGQASAMIESEILGGEIAALPSSGSPTPTCDHVWLCQVDILGASQMFG